MFDLGKNYSDFNVTSPDFVNSGITSIASPLTWNLATDANYSGAWSALFANGAVLANLQYGIMATDTVGGVIAGDYGYVSTWKSGVANFANSPMITALGNHDTYASNNTVNNLFDSHATFANGADVTKTANAVGSIFYPTSGRGGSTNGPVVMGAIGTTMGVIQIVNTDGNFASQTIFGNSASFSLSNTGALVYSVAAVPEADTWAMMMLGLGFMGFVARRKQA